MNKSNLATAEEQLDIDVNKKTNNIISINKNTDTNNQQNIVQDIAISKQIYLVVKRIFDIIISLLGLIILSPIFLIIAVAIKIDSKGSVFFAHKRIGQYGKEIKIYKFRTMCVNAEDMIKDFTPE